LRSPGEIASFGVAQHLGHMRADECTDMLDRLLRFRENCRKQLPHVNHLWPHLQVHVNSISLCTFGQTLGVVEQHLRLSNLNKKRRQVCEIGMKRRNKWCLPISIAGKPDSDRGSSAFANNFCVIFRRSNSAALPWFHDYCHRQMIHEWQSASLALSYRK
jgi:hypothetical protein